MKNFKFAGFGHGTDKQGREILKDYPLPSGIYQNTKIDKRKKGSDFLIISIGSKPCISWKNGKNEQLKSRIALKKLQEKFTWETDF